MSYAEPVVVNNAVVCWAGGSKKSWCVILSQWVWIMVTYAELVVVDHGELCWASWCDSWWGMVSQCL